jgi:nucleotide-binding universal stress UspA family protein
MSFKTILVHVDERPRRAAALELGVQLARSFDAHLVALFALEGSYIPSYAVAEAGPIVQEIEQRWRTEAARAAEAEFRQLERRAGAHTEWRVSMDSALAALRSSALYADLVIAGQPEPRVPLAVSFAGELVLGVGRPVLFVPYAGTFADVGRRVLVAWNGSREASRAVTEALPLLSRAESAEIVSFGNGNEAAPANLALYLARHGVKATAARQSAPGVDVGAQMLSRAADFGADLIVMGAYGHSRVRELVLGGVTRTLFEAMTVPVLMAH